ncbi:MAG: phospholipase [Alcaligenaceae bacterium]|nr:phospholipase [Alcaligenaceae bacterium]
MRYVLYKTLCFLTLCWLPLFSAHAGISYSLVENHAQPGEKITVRALLFNDEANALTWSPPEHLVLQWRHADGDVMRSLASLKQPAQELRVPVNSFTLVEWEAVVPSAAKGVQVLSIEGAPDLFALDTSPNGALLANQLALAPIIDAGAAPIGQPDPEIPQEQLTAQGISPTYGPAVAQAPQNPHSSVVFDNFRNAISSYEPIYFIVGSKPETNARFQVSFKYRLFNPEDEKKSGFHNHLYLAYTQRSLWDLSSDSMPFIDTTYNPSVFWYKEKLWQNNNSPFYLGLNAGAEHESNGKSGDDSRSINDFYIQPEFNYLFDGGSTLTFMPRVKKYFGVSSDNPDYRDYMGNVEWKLRWQQDYGLALTGTYQRGKHNRKTTQVDASWPLKRTPLNMNGYLYAQYYKGYGETLLHYNQRSQSQIRFGIAIIP